MGSSQLTHAVGAGPRPPGPAIPTLPVALGAGAAYAPATAGPVDLGPDTGPTLLLPAVSGWLVTRGWHTLEQESS